jgi:trigger factor
MNDISITKTSEIPGEATLQVEIPAEMVESATNKAASRYAKRARVKGFRKGKVPRNVILRMYKDGIRESVLQDLVNESWKSAIEQEDLKPIADPRIKDLKFEDQEPVTFQLLVEIKPELELERISGFEVKRKVATVVDEMIDQQLEKMAKQKAPWSPVENDKPVLGDLVVASITVVSEGDDNPAEPSPIQLILGDGSAIPEVEERLMEMTAGETKDTTVRYPDDFPDESMRDQSRSIKLDLTEVKRQDLPAMDDDFAREVGDFETVDDLKAAIRKDMEDEATREGDADVRRQLIELLSAANNIIAPEGMVQRVTAAFAEGYEVPQEQFEGFANEFRQIAEARVRRDLILDSLAEKHELKATEDDIDERIAEIAKQRDEEPGQVYASLEKAKRLNELEHSLTEQKIFDFLLEKNTVVDGN